MNAKEIKHLFDSYPEQQEFHLTSDEMPFLRADDAKNYAIERKLEDQNVKVLTKDMASKADPKPAKPNPAKPNAANAKDASAKDASAEDASAEDASAEDASKKESAE